VQHFSLSQAGDSTKNKKLVVFASRAGRNMNDHAKTENFTENPTWASVVPGEQWNVYLDAIRVTRKTGARFVLGGAFGLAGYTGRWRNTKDLDFFVLPGDKDKVIDALTKAGFEDYYPTLAYDRHWIYRATRDEVIVDTIWQTPNCRTVVDEHWFERARPVTLRGENLAVIPAEELLVIKLYVLQRDRCDWPDLINLLYRTAGELDWNHVLKRIGSDEGLLGGLLQVFNWVAPAEALSIPSTIRERFCLREATSEESEKPGTDRKMLLDSRPWFAAHQPTDHPLRL
jgi:hypothetical protein